MKLHKITRMVRGWRDLLCLHTGFHHQEDELCHKYYNGPRRRRPAATEIVVCVDGRFLQGGLSDRLRGIASVYGFCRARDIPFFVHFTYPFRLEDYLEPAGADWRIAPERLTYHPDEARPVLLQCHLLPAKLHRRYLSRAVRRYAGRQLHVYTNTLFADADYRRNFAELFRPTPRLDALLRRAAEAVGPAPYAAVVLRFQQLLGDFREDGYPTLPPDEQQHLIGRCLDAIGRLHAEWPDRTLLVTSDSLTFVRRAVEALPYVRTPGGRVVHMDYTADADFDTYAKSFVDLLMVSRAERVFLLVTGRMYRSGFAKRAALASGVPYREVRF